MTDRQTDRQNTDNYLSIRLTVPKCDHRRILEKIFYDIEYVCYPHKGKVTSKEHFHLFTLNIASKNKLRERLRASGFEGNASLSFKVFHNGLQSAIQYGSKEGTEPYVKGDFLELIETAPKWEQRDIRDYGKMKSVNVKPQERFWMLNRSNLVVQAARYQRCHCPDLMELREVVKKMTIETNWRPDPSLLRLLKDRDEIGYKHIFQMEFQQLINKDYKGHPIDIWWS